MATIIGRPGRLSRASAANGKLGLSVWHSDGGGGVVVLPILFCLRRYLPWRVYGLMSVFIYFTFSPPGSVRVDWLILFDLCSLLCFCIVIRFIARTKIANTLIDRQLQSTPLDMNEWYKRQDSRKIIIGANRTQPLCVCVKPSVRTEKWSTAGSKTQNGTMAAGLIFLSSAYLGSGGNRSTSEMACCGWRGPPDELSERERRMTTSRNYPWERALVIIDRLHIRSHFHWLPLAGPACLPAGIEIGTGHKPTLRCVHRCAHAAKQWTHETGELRAKSVRAFCSRQQPPERLVCQLRLIKANAMGLGDSWTGETQGLWRISLRLEHSEKSFFPTVGRWNFHCAVVQLGRLDGWFFFTRPAFSHQSYQQWPNRHQSRLVIGRRSPVWKLPLDNRKLRTLFWSAFLCRRNCTRHIFRAGVQMQVWWQIRSTIYLSVEVC